MFIDQQLATAGGGTVFALILYAAGSMFVTGPLVIERTVEKSGWASRCEQTVHEEVRSHDGTQTKPPAMSCDMILGSMDSRVRDLMRTFGGDAACKMLDMKRQQEEIVRQAKAMRVQSAMGQAASRCDCAISHLTENKRIAVGLYAGSARLITPAVIRNLESHLRASLYAPACKALASMKETAQ